jgi:RimJ/RimL family protein N-acetyltransferase
MREITQADFENWKEILSDAETMKHYPAPYDDRGVQRWIDWTVSNYAKYGFGLWAVMLKQTGEFIGDCGITMQNINGKELPEIGYHFNKKFWRRGYASEAARKCMEFAFDTLGFPAIYSYMTASNAASYGVAVKNGMKLVEEFDDPDEGPHKVYAMIKEEWDELNK